MSRLFRISQNIYTLLPRSSTFYNANANIIKKNTRGFLIDCGSVFDPGTRYLSRVLKTLGIHSIDKIIITHSHVAHCQNAGDLADQFGAEIIAHKNAAQVFSRLGEASTEVFEFWELIEDTYPRLLSGRFRHFFKILTRNFTVFIFM